MSGKEVQERWIPICRTEISKYNWIPAAVIAAHTSSKSEKGLLLFLRPFLLKCAALKKVCRSVWQNRKLSVVGHNRRNWVKSTPSRSVLFLEQDSTAVPNFAYRSFCPCGNLVGECLPQTLLMRLTPLEKFPQILFGLFQKQFRYTPRFSPISERTPRTERRSTTYETI